MGTRIRVIVGVFFYLMASPCLAAASQGTMSIAPLPQLVKTCQVIVRGKIVKAELETIGIGIDRVTCYIQVGEIIKGKPYLISTEVLGKRIKAIAFSYEDGPSVPGGYSRHNIAENGLWFMFGTSSSLTHDKASSFKENYDSVIEEDSTKVEAVKKLLRETRACYALF
ncbi:MAG: hypothetical protein ACRYFS_22740 [Janthinobacterium lividum]